MRVTSFSGHLLCLLEKCLIFVAFDDVLEFYVGLIEEKVKFKVIDIVVREMIEKILQYF
jgi:hypothetical protein